MILAVDKFHQFILPNTVKVFAVSISEFVDALIVAMLLGSQAMAIVNLGSPIVLVVATLSTLLIVGGSTLYANLCGAFNKPEAERVFTISTIAALTVSSFLTLVALPLTGTITSLLCVGDEELIRESSHYIAILIASMPVLTVANVLFGFLPSAGKPNMSSWLMLLANLINVSLDVVFIRFCGMGIEGAAYATLCGYSVALAVYLVLYIRRQVNMRLVRVSLSAFASLKSVCSMGISAALSQLGFVIKVTAGNALVLFFSGQAALIALSVCMQLLSVCSIFVGGIGSSMINITATLQGQRDFAASDLVVRRAYGLIAVCSVVTMVLFYLFASDIAVVYKATEPAEFAMTVRAIHIFSLMILLRSLVIVFMFYVQSIGMSTYASFISLFDGFAGQLPLAYVGCLCFGIDGFWWSFPLTSVLLFIVVLAWNRHLYLSRQPSPFRNLLLIERDTRLQAEESGSELLTNADQSALLLHPMLQDADWHTPLAVYLSDMLQHRCPLKLDYHIRQYPDQLILDIRTSVNDFKNLSLNASEGTQVINEMVLDMNCLCLAKPDIADGMKRDFDELIHEKRGTTWWLHFAVRSKNNRRKILFDMR